MLVLLRSKAKICCSEMKTKINTSTVKESDEDEMGTIFLKKDIYYRFNHFLLCVFLAFFLFQNKNCWHFEFPMNQLFGQRFIKFETLRYRNPLLLKLRAVKVATSFHWISPSCDSWMFMKKNPDRIYIINIITSTRK